MAESATAGRCYRKLVMDTSIYHSIMPGLSCFWMDFQVPSTVGSEIDRLKLQYGISRDIFLQLGGCYLPPTFCSSVFQFLQPDEPIFILPNTSSELPEGVPHFIIDSIRGGIGITPPAGGTVFAVETPPESSAENSSQMVTDEDSTTALAGSLPNDLSQMEVAIAAGDSSTEVSTGSSSSADFSQMEVATAHGDSTEVSTGSSTLGYSVPLISVDLSRELEVPTEVATTTTTTVPVWREGVVAESVEFHADVPTESKRGRGGGRKSSEVSDDTNGFKGGINPSIRDSGTPERRRSLRIPRLSLTPERRRSLRISRTPTPERRRSLRTSKRSREEDNENKGVGQEKSGNMDQDQAKGPKRLRTSPGTLASLSTNDHAEDQGAVSGATTGDNEHLVKGQDWKPVSRTIRRGALTAQYATKEQRNSEQLQQNRRGSVEEETGLTARSEDTGVFVDPSSETDRSGGLLEVAAVVVQSGNKSFSES